jgi:hypothetical protein
MSNVVRLDVVNPVGVLVDELGFVRDQIKVLKQKEKMYLDQLKRLEVTKMDGKEFSMYLKVAERKTLNTKELKDEYGLEWYEGHCKTSTVKSIVTSRK